jgi:hypothetical protein
MSQEDLLKVVKNQILAKKKFEARISELQTSNLSLCQTEEVITHDFFFDCYCLNFSSNFVMNSMTNKSNRKI